MVKNSRRKQKRNRRKTYKKKMVGGEFNSSDVSELLSLGFTNEDIEFLSIVSPNINLIRQSLQQINPETGSLFTPQEIMQSAHQAYNENMDENDISQISDDDEDMYDYPDSTNTSQESLSNSNLDNSTFDNSSLMDSLHDSDLNISNIASQNTSVSSTSMGGKKQRKTNKKRSKGKSRKSRRRNKKGGNCYGRGVGTNSYDPNYSIYNTNLLNLFPYKPTK